MLRFAFINQKKFTFTQLFTYSLTYLFTNLLTNSIDAVKRLIKISPKLHLENCSNFVRGYSVLRFLGTAEKEGWKMNHTCVRVAIELSVYALFIFCT